MEVTLRNSFPSTMSTNAITVDGFEEAPPRETSQDRLLKMIQARWPEYHPIIAMVELAHDTEDETVELNCHKEVAKYVVAVDKFVEVKTEIKKTKRVIVQLFGGQQQNAVPLEMAQDVTDLTPKLDARASSVLVPSVNAESSDVAEVRTMTASSGPVEDREEDGTGHRIGASALQGVWGDPDVSRSLEGRYGRER